MQSDSPARTRNRQSYHHGDLKRALMDAAELELAAKGFEGFSLRGVAKRADVSHGAPAHHFTDVSGLLTAIAARGYERFIAAQNRRESQAGDGPRAKLVASGLGYIDFAIENPSLFRLMFSSGRPDKSNLELTQGADAAFEKLVGHIRSITHSDPHTDAPAMTDVFAAWAVAHGLADLLIANGLSRATFLKPMSASERDEFFSEIILRAVPAIRDEP
ncbi:MAG: TetR/AcrR family transcriptional regulator [Pseudomonadota bacterium]